MQHSSNISLYNNPLIRLVAEPKFRWLRHTLFILLGLILAFKGDITSFNFSELPEVKRTMIKADVYMFIAIESIIYLLILVLVPRLLFRGRVFLFAVCFFALLSLIFLLVYYIDVWMLRPADDPAKPVLPHVEFTFVSWLGYSAVAAVLLSSVVGLCLFKKWINDVQRMNELQQTNLRTELEQLKSQVNPHFLFNTLNNLLVLTKTDPDKASAVLLGLSDLLRYQLYESATEKILLSKDIRFINNLLELEKIRKNDFSYEIKVEGNADNIKLPPFLFIPFVENAVKHGASSVGHSYITVRFHINDGHLHFTTENSKPVIRTSVTGGIGLKNITRRLELLYPGEHQLQLTDSKEKYLVNLTLPV